jgi:hypothetical protein
VKEEKEEAEKLEEEEEEVKEKDKAERKGRSRRRKGRIIRAFLYPQSHAVCRVVSVSLYHQFLLLHFAFSFSAMEGFSPISPVVQSI